MKEMLLGAQKQHKEQCHGELNNGIMAVLKYWGDPDSQFDQYQLQQQKLAAEVQRALILQNHEEKKMIGYQSDERGDKQYTGYMKQSGRNSIALVPITETQHNLRAQ